MFHWTPWALPGLAVFFVGLALAYFIYQSRPERVQNRRLAVQLVFEAVVVGLLAGSTWVFTDPQLVRALGLTAMVLVWPKLYTYYNFLATLDTPLARPLRAPGRLTALLIFTLIAGATVLVRPDWYGSAVTEWPAVRAIHMPPGTAFVPIFWMWSAMWVVGLSLSISAFRQARTDLRREQARAYMIAFGTRDISFTIITALFTFVPPTFKYFHWVFMAFPAVWLIYYPLVAHGILKHQLFDIDLRVKQGIQKSVLAGAIAGMFFVGNYALEQIIQVNSFVLGLLAAALLTAAFQPLQKLAARIVDGIMPGVSPSENYLMVRKHEVYRDAAEGACQDGVITERERAILTKLQSALGITQLEAARIEQDVRAALAPSTAANLAAAM